MKNISFKYRRIVKLALLVPVSFFGLILALYYGWIFIGERLLHSDEWCFNRELAGHNSVELLSACRELMIDPERFRQHPSRPIWADDQSIYLELEGKSSFTNDIPPVLLALRPMWIHIRNDRVLVRLNVPDRRIYLVAFSSRSAQYGSRKLIDGLWYWNGTKPKREDARL